MAAGMGASHGMAEGRLVAYCLIPRDLAAKLHDPLRAHFRDDPTVEVVVERRGRERRSGAERRSAPSTTTGARRKVNNEAGRRVGDRRALTSEVAPRALPRKAQRYADRLVFLERLEPSPEHVEDLDSARLVIAFQGGDPTPLDELYLRYFERVYSYLRLVLKDSHEAEDATQQVFINVMKALPRYERRTQPFRAWLFAVVRNEGLNRLRARGHVEPADPAEITRRAEASLAVEETDLEALQWISDKDLVFLVERLPLPQRQVLMLRYLADLSAPDIASILGRSPDDVRMLQHRAQRYLRERLSALGRGPQRRSKSPVLRRVPEATVLRARRYCIARQGATARTG